MRRTAYEGRRELTRPVDLLKEPRHVARNESCQRRVAIAVAIPVRLQNIEALLRKIKESQRG